MREESASPRARDIPDSSGLARLRSLRWSRRGSRGGLGAPARRPSFAPGLSLALLLAVGLSTGCASWPLRGGGAIRVPWFRIEVVDRATGRGIPAVELRTTDQRTFWTDSAGVVALMEPELMGRRVFFTAETFGYDWPTHRDGLLSTLEVRPGATAVIAMRRLNVAQRLYRITGTDIYRDSRLLGDEVPIPPDPEGIIPTGADSVNVTHHRDGLFWLWNDTRLTVTRLGIFRTTGATSPLPWTPGFDPDRAIPLTPMREDGRPRALVDDPHPVVWLQALRVADAGSEDARLVAHYRKVAPPMETVEQGVARFDDERGVFELVRPWPKRTGFETDGQVFRHRDTDGEHFHYGPALRSGTDWESLSDPSRYEVFTCRAGGTGSSPSWGWVPAPDVAAGRAGQDCPEWIRTTDIETGAPVQLHNGSLHWNPWRGRWIMIRTQQGGDASYLGEIWYMEADHPTGPWVYARRIVTHQWPAPGTSKPGDEPPPRARSYSFYNPTQHPQFDADEGRVVYFEGTYSTFLAQDSIPTPGYDYNQILYKLELDDRRLALPVAIHRLKGPERRLRRSAKIPKGVAQGRLAFFAVDRRIRGSVPVFELPLEGGNGYKLVAGLRPGRARPGQPLFFCRPVPDAEATTERDGEILQPLWEFIRADGSRRYAVEAKAGPNEARQPEPICRVWRNPLPDGLF